MNLLVSLSKTKQKKRAIASAIVCGFLLVLPSCIPHLRHPERAPDLPERYNLRQADTGPDLPKVFEEPTSLENSSQVRIEEFFQDPRLLSLISQALVGNQELRILGEEVQIASNEILARQGAYLPFVNPGVSAGLNKYSSFTLPGAGIRDDPFRSGGFFPNPLPDYLLGFTFLWTPDIWRQLHNARDAAGQRYFAAGERRNYFVTQLVAEIADNYYGLMALDKRLENLDKIIALQEQNLRFAQAAKEAARGTELAVQRFLAEVRRNQSEKLVVKQDIIQVENRINFLVGRFPQPVERMTARVIEQFINLKVHSLSVGVPAQLLQNRPDIRQAERDLAATGLDVLVARKRFYPQGLINSGVGYEAFNPRYLFITPEALVANVAGNLVTPFINRKAIKADYFTANARQLRAVYNYQRVILDAVAEVVNRMSKVQNYLSSIEIKKQAVTSLEASVEAATSLFQNPRADTRIDYLDVLTAQRELLEARRLLIDTKREQLSAVVNTYQALGGGAYLFPLPVPKPLQSHQWWHHLSLSRASKAAGSGPKPLPTLAAAGRDPEAIPAPAPPSDSGPFRSPTAGSGPVIPPTPAAASAPLPLSTPAPDGLPEPLPTAGDAKGSGTGSKADDPPR
jgi:multidrug efflux system outer membrane protein